MTLTRNSVIKNTEDRDCTGFDFGLDSKYFSDPTNSFAFLCIHLPPDIIPTVSVEIWEPFY